MKGRAVMERVTRMAASSVAAGEMDEAESRVLIEDLGDVVQVYVVGSELLIRARQAREAREQEDTG